MFQFTPPHLQCGALANQRLDFGRLHAEELPQVRDGQSLLLLGNLGA
jgi:hypothetical protein